ncbi:hypothetical protein [Pelagicoccus sp. SDUM812002]|uniref:hypothetical protein n=1 Tax=Pelagicoccus sp. SDUM812002 TaxID=3041266 RepID=UPI00280E1B44|nr:hypothetical protein [Pelagicoccus sp. SDUM812002]MDQ8185320.1 hypothetical protein [Pelagicoccus sp. SDUM812002]
MFFAAQRYRLLIVVGLLAVVTVASAKRFNILVNAEADAYYMAKAEKLEYQTYHVIKGKYHGGSTRDRGLETTQFEDLFDSLAETLSIRNMYPEQDRYQGDLLIMVSWGRTSLDPDWGELQGITGSDDLTGGEAAEQQGGGVNPTSAGAAMAASQTAAPIDTGGGMSLGPNSSSQRSKNMALLGLQGKLRSRNLFGFTPDEDLWEALEEERYFVILNAFDYQHLINEKELKQVWRVRYNTRAIGVGFETAFESMNEAIAGVIGVQMDDIAKVKGDTKGTISMGDLEMVEMSDGEKKEMKQ